MLTLFIIVITNNNNIPRAGLRGCGRLTGNKVSTNDGLTRMQGNNSATVYIIICTCFAAIVVYYPNQRANVIIIARKEGGAWERLIINAPLALDLGEGERRR